MEADFWHKRWEEREIGFHQRDINRFLRQYWPSLGLPDDAAVLVPLCGKSKDMLWLAQQGHQVLGIELSEAAVQEFFEEWQVAPTVVQKGQFKSYSAENIELWVGDFFALTAADLAGVRAVYDRAALVALPTGMRQDYVISLTELLPSSSQTLLLTFDYRQSDMDGPPFAIDNKMVEDLFRDTCEIKLLDSQYFDMRGNDASELVFHLRYR